MNSFSWIYIIYCHAKTITFKKCFLLFIFLYYVNSIKNNQKSRSVILLAFRIMLMDLLRIFNNKKSSSDNQILKS